jgi:hypothetical protein
LLEAARRVLDLTDKIILLDELLQLI